MEAVRGKIQVSWAEAIEHQVTLDVKELRRSDREPVDGSDGAHNPKVGFLRALQSRGRGRQGGAVFLNGELPEKRGSPFQPPRTGSR